MVKQSSRISAVEDEDGKLITNRQLIEDIVLEELAKIFKGERSEIFEFKGEQFLSAAHVFHHGDQSDWIRPTGSPNYFEKEVCNPISLTEVKEIVLKHKDNRASGIDEISTRLLKNASPLFYTYLTEMINKCLETGSTPKALNVGKMTLINKKEASLKISNKRPITVSSQILSVITKILNSRMMEVCERENFFGATQYGFRPGRSTTDCIFLLLAAIRKAKKKKFKISMAFCDLQKAYDSVNREILYKLLQSIGFGGRVLSMVQSMYFNDCVQVNLGFKMSAPLWFTQGVKQGCSLSPLLFSLYMSGLGERLQKTEVGIKLGHITLSGLFFADDLVLISRTSNRGMNRLLLLVDKFCRDMSMNLSVSKTFVLSNGPKNRKWKIGESGDYLQETLIAKYLGINIQLRGRNTICREKDIVSLARRYAHTILSITRAGLDRSMVARQLWETCAVPAFLYGSETRYISSRTIGELEKLQSCRSQGRPLKCQHGLMSIKYRIWLRQGSVTRLTEQDIYITN